MSKSKKGNSSMLVVVLVVALLFFLWSSSQSKNNVPGPPPPGSTGGGSNRSSGNNTGTSGASTNSGSSGSSSSSSSSSGGSKYGFSMNGPMMAWKWISKGDKSREVMYVQMAINRVKRLQGKPTISTDGYFGPETEDAVKELMGRKSTKYSLVKQKVIVVYRAAGKPNPYTSGLNFSGHYG